MFSDTVNKTYFFVIHYIDRRIFRATSQQQSPKMAVTRRAVQREAANASASEARPGPGILPALRPNALQTI